MTMKKVEKVICDYCSTINPRDLGSCIACGAPLSSSNNEQSPKDKISTSSITSEKNESTIEINKVGEKIDEAYFTLMNTYAIAWRTVGEAIAIALASFIIGAAAGSTGMSGWGILGSIALGISVGITKKPFLAVLFSAPSASLIGLFAGGVIWIIGKPEILVFVVSVFSIFGALIGGKQQTKFASRNLWEKSRPFFGTLGGLFFGLLGILVGYGIAKTISIF